MTRPRLHRAAGAILRATVLAIALLGPVAGTGCQNDRKMIDRHEHILQEEEE